jgi:hypothetical protein
LKEIDAAAFRGKIDRKEIAWAIPSLARVVLELVTDSYR